MGKIHAAAKAGDVKAVQELSSVEDINGADHDGRTPLHWAADKGHPAVVQLLLTKGADLNARSKVW